MKTSASKEFADVVQQIMQETGKTYHDAYMYAKIFRAPKLYQAANESGSLEQRKAAKAKALNEMGRLVDAEIKRTGISYSIAAGIIAKQRPDLSEAISAVNELPANVEISLDGELLAPEWPVKSSVLLSLGLPIAATREQYSIARAADKVKATPQIASKIIMAIVQFGQITQGVSFSEAYANLKKHRPEIFKALQKVS